MFQRSESATAVGGELVAFWVQFGWPFPIERSGVAGDSLLLKLMVTESEDEQHTSKWNEFESFGLWCEDGSAILGIARITCREREEQSLVIGLTRPSNWRPWRLYGPNECTLSSDGHPVDKVMDLMRGGQRG